MPGPGSASSADALLYEQIAGSLRERIAGGKYPLNAKLPSEQVLSGEFGVSRPTVKNAVRLLEREGLIRTRPAVGSFVIRRTPQEILVGYIAPSLSDPFHGEVVEQLDRSLQPAGGGLIVAGGGRDASAVAKSVRRLAASGVTGLLISCAPETDPKKIESLGIPLVWCGGVPDSARFDRVTVDNDHGIGELIDHLREMGAKTCAYAQNRVRQTGADPRSRAFLNCVRARGLHTEERWQVGTESEGEDGGREALARLLERGPLPDALVCCNDLTAAGALRAALERGIAVPDRLKITGFDNLPVGSWLQVPLTTVDYRIPELVNTALSLLRTRLREPGRQPESALLRGRLVVRASTAPSAQGDDR